MIIQILVDNPDSWIVPYANELVSGLRARGHQAVLLHEHTGVGEGDILCLLACEKPFKNLHLNKHNLVVHESDLPKGRGWSPVTWQVLEGCDTIPVTLFEATESVDAGSIYNQKFIKLEGHELLGEIKHLQGSTTNELILDFVDAYPRASSRAQQGEPSFYRKRGPQDSELDVQKTLAEQFNLLRVCDNERYPAFFYMMGVKYIVKIEKSPSGIHLHSNQ